MKKKSREQELDIKVNSILSSLAGDINNFTDEEQVEILKTVIIRWKDKKTKDRDEALEFANNITQSLKQFK